MSEVIIMPFYNTSEFANAEELLRNTMIPSFLYPPILLIGTSSNFQRETEPQEEGSQELAREGESET